MSLKVQIAGEIYKALQHLGADGELLSVVGSYGDSLDDEDVLALLKHWSKRNVAAPQPSKRAH